MNAQPLAEIKALSEKIATELVFGEPGTDLGLLPINSLLGQIEERLNQTGGPEALVTGAQIARRWLDEVFDTTGTFSQAMLERFGEWITWWQEALTACEAETPPPKPPEQWNTAAASPASSPTAPVPGPSSAAPAPAPSAPEPQVVLDLAEDGELLREFMNESQEHLQNIEQGVLTLETNPADVDTLNSIFRAFHTFKGGSGFLNLLAIQSLAHELESLLDLARQHKIAITPGIINLILEGGDTLKRFVSEIAAQLAGTSPPAPIVVPTLGLLAAIQGALSGSAQPERPTPPKQVVAEPMVQPKPVPPPTSVEKTTSSAPVETVAPAPKRAEPSVSAPAVAEGQREPAVAVKINAAGLAVKVDTQKLDSLVDLVGEMVIAQSLVAQNQEISLLRSERLARDLAHLGRITKDLQRVVMALRMVPIRGTFQKMNRLVRDSAAKLGKQVELVMEGEDTELDRTIVEEISDPLIHMIRNAVDHGIEMPDLRRQRGKPEQGTIRLRAFHQGGNIVIEINDDGNGLNRERILAKAIEKGLASPGEQLSEAQVFNLIMSPGFSTAEKVTDLSGRGVGMDVVRRNIEKLRGKIQVQSRDGHGSTFHIYLPLTMAIIDGLLIGVGEHRYLLPTLLVRESFRPTASMLSTVHGRGEMVNVRGHLLPLLRLYDYLGIEPASKDPTESIVVVVEVGAAARCVLVDNLLGKQEVVIKSLGETFRRNRCIAGAAILGDGRVGLILDPQALVHLDSVTLEAAA